MVENAVTNWYKAFATIYFANIAVGYFLANMIKKRLKKIVCDNWDIIPQLLFLIRLFLKNFETGLVIKFIKYY
jgi:hypothetical protein